MVDFNAIASGINSVWVLTVSFLIFFMQPGFAMLEAGQVRAKNVANVLMKNMMDWCLGVLIYFLVGSGIAAVAAGLTSSGGFSMAEAFAYINDPSAWVGWLFGAVFAMTAATIVSGAVAERLHFKAYLFYSIALTAVIYPVVQGFAWGGGLLSAGGYLGQAVGSAFGIAAVWGTWTSRERPWFTCSAASPDSWARTWSALVAVASIRTATACRFPATR